MMVDIFVISFRQGHALCTSIIALFHYTLGLISQQGWTKTNLRSSTGSGWLRPSPFLPRELLFHSLMTSTSSLSESSEPFFLPFPCFFFLLEIESSGRHKRQVELLIQDMRKLRKMRGQNGLQSREKKYTFSFSVVLKALKSKSSA